MNRISRTFILFTTTTWLFDSLFENNSGTFDAVPFRIAHLFYYIIAASLLITLFRRFGHLLRSWLCWAPCSMQFIRFTPNGVAWLSARKDLVSLLLILVSLLAWLWALGPLLRQNQWTITIRNRRSPCSRGSSRKADRRDPSSVVRSL